MMRVAGVSIPKDKKIKVALTYVYGIGRSRAEEVLENMNPDEESDEIKEKRTKELTKEEKTKVRQLIEKNYKVEGDLRKEVNENIKRLKEIDSYRGERHEKDLPVRGQQTQTNSRTTRGNVRDTTAPSGRKKGLEKK
ncbi:MAG: 30S ribosomal protein S13 [Parcubacteria group bacterium QH_9_35_7]|nr:MAG: 30S ribosomal protein S13 [Parcubacteria group bacterium QH_9_35_7]